MEKEELMNDEEKEKKLIEEAIRLNGSGGVNTILCPHCGELVMTNYVPLRKFWAEKGKGESPSR
jgi:hypothetical protein